MKTLHTLNEVSVKGKRVLVRVDFNVPMDPKTGKITDDTRIRRSLPTIQYLRKKGAKVILISHLGRPDGRMVESLKLEPIRKHLSRLLKTTVKAEPPGEVVLLENIRFYKEEEKNDPKFAKKLASTADIFVNDGFSVSHRAHASTAAVAKFLPAYAGLLMEQEVKALFLLSKKITRPFVLVMGGAKIDDKIGVLKAMIGKADAFLIGGGLANTFLHAAGYDVGQSLCQKDKADLAREIMFLAEKKKAKFYLPIDAVTANEIGDRVSWIYGPIEDVEGDMKILDLGKRTIKKYKEILKTAKTIVWNGPMGMMEYLPFQKGTKAVAEAIAKNRKATTIIGGGDTIDALHRFKIPEKRFTHVSTGGGAMMEFLEGKKLPGVEALYW